MALLIIVLTQIPTSKAQTINDGDYYIYGPNSGFNKLTVHWDVYSGPAIDVFIFTSAQYTSWLSIFPADPISAVHESYDTSSGEITMTIHRTTTYYVILSNANGLTPASMTSGASWSGGIAGFEFIMTFLGIITLIGIALSLKKRPANIF